MAGRWLVRVVAAKIALAPLLLWQGRQVRARALRLPEAGGARCGAAGVGEGKLRLLIVGDSSAAGVGAPSQDLALSGRLAQALARRLGGTVQWQLQARTGHTAAQALQALREVQLQPADVAITALGVNDVTGQVGAGNWLKALDALDQLLRERCGVRYTLHCGVPPMQHFTLLPQPLRWWMGLQAQGFNRRLQARLAGEVARSVLTLPDELHRLPAADARGHDGNPEGRALGPLMATDGFHPSPEGYAVWAEAVAEALVERMTETAGRQAGQPGLR